MSKKKKCTSCKNYFVSESKSLNNYCSGDCIRKAMVKKSSEKHRPIKTIGKVSIQWKKTRTEWFSENPPNANGYYKCYICRRYLLPEQTTLDHLKSRSRRPDLRFDKSNLRPCCWECNTEKGSKNYEDV